MRTTAPTSTSSRHFRPMQDLPPRRYLEVNEAATLLGVPERVLCDHVRLSISRW